MTDKYDKQNQDDWMKHYKDRYAVEKSKKIKRKNHIKEELFPNNENKTASIKKVLLIGGLAAWYIFTTPSSNNITPISERYILPKEIKVTETTLPTHTKKNQNGTLDYYITTEDIAKYDEFKIKTPRYSVEKGKDWAINRGIGHVMSLPRKALFWDWDVSRGVDAEKTNAFIAMLEKDTTINNLMVRLGHNEAWNDFYRLFADEKLKERNGFLARTLIGIPTTVMHEMWAEFARGDYYNPLTRTAVIYSNIESIGAHEIGHNKDFSRYDRDWLYQLLRPVLPVMLYQEARASLYARDDIMSDKDKWQFNRYLIPAFATYLLYSFGKIKKWTTKKKD
ncbi:MAG: hypothetical protein ACP5N1_05355 [Candidatus Woesearchaeota archaeon]